MQHLQVHAATAHPDLELDDETVSALTALIKTA
jgi:hypothetical protein